MSMDAFYRGAAEHFHGGDSTVGGGNYKVGGLKDLADYDSAVISKAKEKLIRDIANAAKKKLDIKSLNPEAKDVNDIVKQFVKSFPDPKRNKLTFKGDKKLQEKVCRTMADIINKEFATEVIDTKADLPELCEATAEVMNTLFVGMQGEFVSVRDDVRRSLANLETLRMYLEQTHQALANRLANSDDADVKGASSNIRELNRAITTELSRQIKLLENMLNVVSPAEKSLGELLHKQKDLKLMVSKIKAAPGSAQFGEKVSYMLSGIGTTAYAAAVVDSALKKLGMSVKDYEGMKDLKELKKKVQSAALDKMGNAKDTEDLLSMLKAVDVIIRNDYRHDDIVKHLKGKVGGKVAKKGKKSASKKTKKSKKGKGEEGVTGGVTLDKRVKKTQDIRKRLFKIFNGRLNDIFHKISASSQMMVKKIGTEIPLGDALRKFVNAFDMLDNFRQMNIYYSLSGYSRSIEAKETREKFISKVHNVMSAIDELKAVKNVSVLGDLNMSFKALINLIEEMDSAFEKVPAVAPKYCDSKEAAKSGAKEGAQDVAGRMDDEIIGGSELSEITRVAYTLDQAQKEVKYYYYTARARSGFKISAKELESIRCEYPKVLGEAIAQKRDENRDKVAKYVKNVKDVDNRDEGIPKALHGDVMDEGSPEDTKNMIEKKSKAIIAFANKKAQARDGLYKVAEAVDRFMIEFTDAALKNPDDIEEIKLMLDSTEIISDWFTKKSGDLFCEFFEEFPCEVKFGAIINLGGIDVAGSGVHYFDLLNLDPTNVALNAAATADFMRNKITASCGDTLANAQAAFNVAGTDATYEELYRWIVTDNGYTAGNKPKKAQEAQCRANTVKLALKGKNKVVRPGNPFIGKDIESYEVLCEKLTKALDNLSVLKNVVATFTSIGKKLGGEKLYKKTNMTPYQMYSALVEYIKCSALEHRAGTSPVNNVNDLLAMLHDRNIPVGVTDDAGALIANDSKDAPVTQKKGYRGDGGYVLAAPIKGAIRSTNSNLFTQCSCDDELFCMIIKSMVAKVFTVLGIYNLFNRPIEDQSFGKNFTDVRMVLGGSDEAYPKILDGAMELYVRLPLLAEFYRIVFDFDNLHNANNNMITMVPDESGIFGPFIDIMFNKTKYVEEGTYSSTDVINIIREINRIYSQYSGSKSVVSDVVGAFITEVNQRFGLLNREDRLAYLKDKYRSDLSDRPGEGELVDVSILPGGEYGDEPTRPAYSDRYRHAGDIGDVDMKYKYTIESEHKDYVDRLRARINEQFNDASNIERDFDQFDKVVRAKKEELKHARGDSERFAIALSAVNGFGALSTSAIVHSMILFHETVVTGLNSLNVLYTSLRDMYDRVEGMHSSIKIIKKFYGDDGNLGNVVDFDNAAVADLKQGKYDEYVSRNGTDVVLGSDESGYAFNLDLNTLLALGGNADDKREAACRYVFKRRKAFRELVEILAQYGDDNLIEVKVDGCIVHMNSSKLREHVQHIIGHLKELMDKFRGIIPKNILDRYETYNLDGEQNLGSLYYLEEEFLRKFLVGKVKTEGKEGEERFVTDTLDKINTFFKTVMDHITGNFKAVVVDNAGVPQLVATRDGADNKKNNFFNDMSMLVCWDPQNMPNGMQAGSAKLFNSLLRFIYTNTTGKKVGNADPGEILEPYDRYDSYLDSYEISTITDFRSVVALFNQLLANYISTFYDEATHKIYTPLINEFATGTFSTQVMKLKNIMDLVVSTARVNYGGLDVPSSSLMASLGLALREMITRANASGMKHHLENDMAEIPMYMKESYKAYLPIYCKLFKMLRDRCGLLLTLSKEVNVSRNAAGMGNNQDPVDDITVMEISLAAAGTSDKDITAKLKSLITEVMDGCRSVENMIENVLDEINDSPKFLETYTGSIKDFKADEGQLPLMPVSSLTHYLSRGKAGAEYSAWPWHTVATPEYKLLFGSRGMLCGKISYEDAPSMHEMVAFHNQTTTSRHHVSDKMSADLFRETVDIIKYVTDLRQYKSYLGADGNFVAALQVDAVPGVSSYAIQQKKNATCAYRDTVQSIIELVESKNVKARRNELAACISETEKCQSRSKMRAMNILDLNIVPINMHMLAREIPLINLYNYSYTFNKMMAEMILGRGKECPANIPRPGEYREMLCHMVCNPYAIVEHGHINPLIQRIVTGGLGLGMGRPKFIGDELYNKCLLTSLRKGEIMPDGSVNPDIDQGGVTIHNLQSVVDAIGKVGNDNMVADFAPGAFMSDYMMIAYDPTAGDSLTTVAAQVPISALSTALAGERESVRMGMLRFINELSVPAVVTAAPNVGDAAIAKAIIEGEANLGQGGVGSATAADMFAVTLPGFAQDAATVLGMLVYARLAEHYYGANNANIEAFLSTYSHVTHVNNDGKLEGKAAYEPSATNVAYLGVARFNTKLVRNIFWLVNLQRLMRLKMRKDLMWYNTDVVSGHAVVSENITEFKG